MPTTRGSFASRSRLAWKSGAPISICATRNGKKGSPFTMSSTAWLSSKRGLASTIPAETMPYFRASALYSAGRTSRYRILFRGDGQGTPPGRVTW